MAGQPIKKEKGLRFLLSPSLMELLCEPGKTQQGIVICIKLTETLQHCFHTTRLPIYCIACLSGLIACLISLTTSGCSFIY